MSNLVKDGSVLNYVYISTVPNEKVQAFDREKIQSKKDARYYRPQTELTKGSINKVSRLEEVHAQ